MKKNPTTKQNADRFVHAIFCDDIRQEIGNKVSFMGCYQGELFVPFVPMMLAKLCVHVSVFTAVERPLKALTVRLDQGENQLAVIEVPSGDFVRSSAPAPGNDTRLSANVGVMLSPFAITEASEICVVVITEEGQMLGPRLRIKVMPQSDVAADAPAKVPAKPKRRAAPTKRAAKHPADKPMK